MKGLRDPLKDSLCTGPKPMAILRSALGLHLSVYMRDLFVWTGGVPLLNGLPYLPGVPHLPVKGPKSV